MKEKLIKYFNRYVKLSDQEISLFYTNLEIKEFKKKEFLLQERECCKYKYFIIEELVRFYEIDNKGNETINQFGVENWWITNLDSYINESPSRQYI